MKRILAVLLSLIMIICAVPSSIFAMDKSGVDGAVYKNSTYTQKQTYGSVYSFDDLSEFIIGKDFVDGGNYSNAASGVVLTTDFDHTGTLKGGKSLLIKDRAYTYNRIKLLNVISNKELSQADLGKHFVVSAYVLSSESAKIEIGLFNTISNDKYSTSTYVSDIKTLTANEWTRYEFEFTVTQPLIDNFINTLGFSQLSGNASAKIYLDDIVVDYVGDTVIFDDIASFDKETDFILGGAYPEKEENYTLTDEENHNEAGFGGKSFKLSGRTEKEHRVKIKNLIGEAFTSNDKSRAIEVSLYVKTLIDTNMYIGFYGDANTKYAYSPYNGNSFDTKAGEWTKLSVSVIIDDEIIDNQVNMIGVGQKNETGFDVAESVYIDDITVREEAYSFTDVKKGNSDILFSKLPEGEVLCTPDEHISTVSSSPGSENYTKKVVSDSSWSNYGFTQAARYTTKNKPDIPYSYQLRIKNLGSSVVNGDQLLVVCYVRGISSEAEDGKCHFQFVIEDSSDYNKILQADYKFKADGTWQKCYFSSGAAAKYENTLNFNLRCGYEIQEFEVADLKVLRYSAALYPNLTYDDMPDSISAPDGVEPHSLWRREAEQRIKTIRMGMAKVVVKDKNGNPLSGAKVDIDMTDHDFQFGTAVNGTVLSNISNYNNGIKSYFNTAVLESEHKWVEYEKNPSKTRRMYDAIKSLGIKNVRGHTLIWDRDYINKAWEDNTSIPQDVAQNYNNKSYLDTRIETHIKDILTDYYGQLCDWDVVNELTVNHCMTELYNKETLKQWYDWAKKYDPNATRYINETGITGMSDNALDTFCTYLDYMVANNVDFEGIGIQSHFSSACDIESFKRQLDRLASYGKRLKITEFDFNKNGKIQSEFTRDIILLAFSLPQVDGFLGWGFSDKYHWLNNAMLFDKSWNLKDSGKQYVDLVFNKWWTDESGVTDENGEFSSRVFYGDYNVNVNYLGYDFSQTASFTRGADNTLEVVIDTDSFEFTPSKLTGRVYKFDDLSSFANNTDFIGGGGYPSVGSNVVLSDAQDHTTGIGKSLYLKGRTDLVHRIKLINSLGNVSFGGRDLGKQFEITCYIKPNKSGKVCVGLYGPVSTKYATSPYKSLEMTVTENKWNKLTFTVKVDREMVDYDVNMLGIGQKSGTVIDEMYVDDISLIELTGNESFDDENSDFAFDIGGNYDKSKVYVSDNEGYLGTNALLMSERSEASDRIKIKNLFKKSALNSDDLGKTFKVTMRVRANKDTRIRVGTYGGNDSAFRMVPYVKNNYDVTTDWTKIMFTYKIDQKAIDEGADMLGICQASIGANLAESIYIDDISVTAAKNYEPSKYMFKQSGSVSVLDNTATVNLSVEPWINYDDCISEYTVVFASYSGGKLIDAKTEKITSVHLLQSFKKTLKSQSGGNVKTMIIGKNVMPLGSILINKIE